MENLRTADWLKKVQDIYPMKYPIHGEVFFENRIMQYFARLPSFFRHHGRMILTVVVLLAATNVLLPAASAADTDDQVTALIQQASECYRQGDEACAWDALDSAHRIAPDNSVVLYAWSYYLADAKRYDEALEKIDAALDLNPQSSSMWMQKGRIQNSAGRFLESGASFDRAHELNPDIVIPSAYRFPLNLIMKYGAILVVVIGFAGLGIYIYFNERRR
jgi:tetratricopeptide (TPR) repeat protein